ncbi:Protein of uncharacterised function (DUF1523) [Mannheimia haemolytica]|uniref:Protein of uncharacterized function (DUF1523) n=1 Tax=Mannheimia haemolytica TaxID=75985 RepID=A0A378MU78_MANHA|nr:Protein of uncharacterised function (DUF1523) [Mannheimia haemolytica]
MRAILKYFLILVSLSFFIVLGGAVNYAMPSYEDTVVTGMEVRRMDKDGIISKANPADGEVRDVYFLFTEDPETKKVMVYRNEDTGWGCLLISNSDLPTFKPKLKPTLTKNNVCKLNITAGESIG